MKRPTRVQLGLIGALAAVAVAGIVWLERQPRTQDDGRAALSKSNPTGAGDGSSKTVAGSIPSEVPDGLATKKPTEVDKAPRTRLRFSQAKVPWTRDLDAPDRVVVAEARSPLVAVELSTGREVIVLPPGSVNARPKALRDPAFPEVQNGVPLAELPSSSSGHSLGNPTPVRVTLAWLPSLHGPAQQHSTRGTLPAHDRIIKRNPSQPAEAFLPLAALPAAVPADRWDAEVLAQFLAPICGANKPSFSDWEKLCQSREVRRSRFAELLPPVGRGFVMSMCRDLQGRIWIGCEDERSGRTGVGAGGVWCWDPNAKAVDQWRHFTRENTGGAPEQDGPTIRAGDWLGDDNAYAIACDKLGRIWVGHLNHGVSVFNGVNWRNYGVLEGPLGERIFAIASCFADGDIWLATSAGLTRYSLSKDTWNHYTRANGLPADQASAIAFDSDGNIIVGMQGDGLAFAKANENYTLWRHVTCPKEYQYDLPSLSQGNGLPTDLINDVKVSRDGTIYAATVSGLAWSKDQGRTFEFIRGNGRMVRAPAIADGNTSQVADPKGKQSQVSVGVTCLAEDYVTFVVEDEKGLLWLGHRGQRGELFDPTSGHITQAVGVDHIRCILTQSGRTALIGCYGSGVRVDTVGTDTTTRTSLLEQLPQSSVVPLLPSGAKSPTVAELEELLGRIRRAGTDVVQPSPNLGEVSTPNARGLVSPLNDDWRTEGDWYGRYGRVWFDLCAMDSPQSYISGAARPAVRCAELIGPRSGENNSARYWVHWLYTDQRRCMELPPPYLAPRLEKGMTTEDRGRRQAELDDNGEAFPRSLDGPHLYFGLRVPPGTYMLSLYFVNKDGHTGSNRDRDFRIEVRDFDLSTAGYGDRVSLRAQEGFRQAPLLAQSRICDFWSGTYKRFIVRGGRPISICIMRNGSFNTVCSAVMLDFLDELAPPYHWTSDRWSALLASNLNARDSLGIHGWQESDLGDRQRLRAASVDAIATSWKLGSAPSANNTFVVAANLCRAIQALSEMNPREGATLRPIIAAAAMRSLFSANSDDRGTSIENLARHRATACFLAGAYRSWEKDLAAAGIEPARAMKDVPILPAKQ